MCVGFGNNILQKGFFKQILVHESSLGKIVYDVPNINVYETVVNAFTKVLLSDDFVGDEADVDV